MIQRSPHLIHMTFTIDFLSLLTWKKEAAGCVACRSGALPGISFQISSLNIPSSLCQSQQRKMHFPLSLWHLQAGSLKCTPPTQKKNTRVIWLQTLNYTPRVWSQFCTAHLQFGRNWVRRTESKSSHHGCCGWLCCLYRLTSWKKSNVVWFISWQYTIYAKWE